MIVFIILSSVCVHSLIVDLLYIRSSELLSFGFIAVLSWNDPKKCESESKVVVVIVVVLFRSDDELYIRLIRGVALFLRCVVILKITIEAFV